MLGEQEHLVRDPTRERGDARGPDIADGDVQEIKQASIGDMSLTNLEVIFADFHVFKLWGLDQQPAMLIGMDMIGVLERLVIDYRRNEVSMYGDRAASRIVAR